MTARRNRPKLLLTQRALQDIAEIEAFSITEWGEEVAAKYISDIEAAIQRVVDKPSLLRPVEDLHPDLKFYRVNKHVLVCDVQTKAIFLLTVIHASRDIPSRLAQMAPSLAMEVDLLHNQLKQRR